MNCLKGKTAIITGASSGVGFSIAEKLINCGVSLGFLSRSKPKLKGYYIYSDLSNAKSTLNSISNLIRNFKNIDFLINNSGTFLEKSILNTEIEEWQYVHNVNLLSPFIIIKKILPIMIKKKMGKIVNIASSSAISGKINQSAYCSSKHGLLGLSRAISEEFKSDNIHVYTICPGGINTDFLKNTQIEKTLKKDTLINPKEIADLVVFLLKQSYHINIDEINITRFNKN